MLKKIQINNFLSHSDTLLEVDDHQKFLLDGVSGSGKSSIVDALVWCLFFRGRSNNRSLIKKGKKYAKIVVTLKDKDGIEYNINRSITSTGKHDLSVTYKKATGKRFLPVEVSGIKNIQEYIEKQMIHSNYLLFVNSVVYPQDNSESFVKQTAAKRKEIILEIINASNYDEYYAKAKDKVKELEIATGSYEVAITGMTNKLKGDKENLPSLSMLEIELKDTLETEEEGAKEIEIISKKKIKIDSVISRKSDKDNDLVILYNVEQELITKIENLNKKKLSFSSINTDELKKDIEKAKNELSGFKKITIKISAWNEKMMELINLAPVDMDYEEIGERINLQIISLMKKNVETCPEINKPCPIIVREKDSKLVELSNDLDRNAKEKNTYLEKKEKYNKQVLLLGEKPVIDNAKISSLENFIEQSEKKLKEAEQGTTDIVINISVKEKELEIVKTTRNKLEEEIEALGLKIDESKIEYQSENFENLNEEQNKLISHRQKLEQKIAITKNNIDRIEKDAEILKSMKNKIKDDQETLESMKLLKEALGNNGIKAIVIDYIIPRIEDRINAILGKLSDFRVRLDTQTRSISEESTKEGLYIDILTPEGEQLSYENFSGGEKVKVSSAIFEGLASFQKCKFRILDESIIALDNESTRQFIDVVKAVQKNVAQLMVISHIQEVKDCFQEKINIVKINGDSFINNTKT